MTGLDTRWIRSYAGKLDRHLRHEILACYRPPRLAPCLLGRFLIPWRLRRRVPVIIQLRDACGVDDCFEIASRLSAVDGRHVNVLKVIRGVAAEVSISGLPPLVEDERVSRVVYDRPVRAFMDIAAPTVLAPALWESGLTGEGVTVAVIDTGIYPHPDFTVPENRIVAFRDFVGNRSQPYDDNGHGTHVAGTIAGNGHRSNGLYRGIAPNARLVGVKVLDSYGGGSLSTVIQGIDWCVENKDRLGIRVINMSLGAPAQESFHSDPLALAAYSAWQAGIVVCAAAGNDGPESRTIATPGVHPNVITVGASDCRGNTDRQDDTVAPFSSRGPTIDNIQKPDLVAPGVSITSTAARKSVLSLIQGRKLSEYITLSGTSMATPMVSGVVALMLQAEPTLDPDTVRERLLETADSLGFGPNTQGRGLVNAERAVEGFDHGATPI